MDSRNVATPRFRSRFSIVNSPGRQLGDLAMFNFSLYPYARWLLDRSQGDVPGFNIDAPGDGAPTGGMLAAPPTPQSPNWPQAPGFMLGSQNALSSALPTDAPGLRITPGNNLPGFHLDPQDELTTSVSTRMTVCEKELGPAKYLRMRRRPSMATARQRGRSRQASRTRPNQGHRRFLIGSTS